MNTIEFPKKLLKIPYPWNITSHKMRRQEKKKLERTEENFENALFATEMLLDSLQNLSLPKGENIPKDLIDYWDFTSEFIADYAPQVNKVTYDHIETVVKSHGFDSLSEKALEEIVEMWVWTTVRDIANLSVIWIEDNIDTRENAKYVKELIRISSSYWNKVPCSLAASLISASGRFTLDESIEFLKEVENLSPSIEQKEYARDLRRLKES